MSQSDDNELPEDDLKFVPTPHFGKWLVLICCIITIGFGMAIPISLSVLFLDWQETFQVSRAHTAVVHSACVGFLFGAAVFAGLVTNQLGSRLTILTGSVLATLGLLASMFATSINFLIATTGVMAGFGFCFIQLPVFPCLTSVFTKYQTLGLALCSNGIGIFSILNRYFLRFLADHYSWRGACAIIAGVALNLSVTGMVITSVSKPRQTLTLVIQEEPQQDDTGTSSEQQTNCAATETSDGCRDFNAFEDNSTLEIDTSESSKFIGNPDISAQNLDKKRVPSDWTFLTDVAFLAVVSHVSFGLATVYSFCLLGMDYAKNLGFGESTGVFFLTIVYALSIVGRTFVGVKDFVPHIPVLYLQAFLSLPCGMACILLSFCTGQAVVTGLLCVIGFIMGTTIAIYPKSTLDIKSVNKKSYPLALGIVCTFEGVVNLFFPIVIGYTVDMTGSYTLILALTGCVSLLASVLLALAQVYSKKK